MRTLITMNPGRRWLAAALALGLCACVTVGSEFPHEAVSQIEIGRTTQSDIQRLFGEPWRTGIEDGDRTWTYGHYRYSAFRDANTSDLVVRFDDRGVVRSYTYNTTEQ